MPSPFTAQAQAIQALLLVAPPVADMVVRDRLRPLAKHQQSAVVIKIDKTQGQRAGTAGGPTDWGTLYVLECYSRSAANVLPSDAVDPILTAVFERLSGAGEALGPDVEDALPDPRIEWDLAQAAEELASAAIVVRIVHRTRAAQLQPWTS